MLSAGPSLCREYLSTLPEVLRQIMGLELRPDPSEAWLMLGRAPGTCSREPPPLEHRDDTEPEDDRKTSSNYYFYESMLHFYKIYGL